MTSNHLFFIPTIFFLGFFLGLAISDFVFHKRSKLNTQKTEAKIKGRTLAIVFGIFAIVFILTHILPIPGGVKYLHTSLGHQQLFDQHISMSADEIYSRMDAFNEAGRDAYIRFTYTSDLLFPLSFLLFLITLAKFVQERTNLRRALRQTLVFIPVFWFVSDMIENTVIYFLLTSFPEKNYFLASILGPISILKYGFLLLSIVFPTITFVAFRKTENQQNNLELQVTSRKV